jgi:hypothetical protein
MGDRGSREHLRAALWHSRQCGEAIERACAALGVDPGAPVEESGLVPAPPESDFAGPDHVPSTTPLPDDLENPQSRYLQLVKAYNDRRIR